MGVVPLPVLVDDVHQVVGFFAICKRFRTAYKALGPDRLRTLKIHHGRHTFISHAQ
jgi:hypothetical protein